MIKDALGERLKHNYEEVSKTRLTRRMPVMIRIDGKCFHQFTKGIKKPFDDILVETMQETMKYLCENIQGCVLGYTQSDEITLVLQDYKELTTDAWFDYEVQKICSISASMATLAFNRIFNDKVDRYIKDSNDIYLYRSINNLPYSVEDLEYCGLLKQKCYKGATFDARCFNVPKEEVTNFVFWRQIDAERNSVNSVAQANFSHKELQGKGINEVKTMLEDKKGIVWGDLRTTLKRGSCCVKQLSFTNETGNMTTIFKENELYKIQHEEGFDASKIRTEWVIDNDIPRFVNEGREYIENLINF